MSEKPDRSYSIVGADPFKPPDYVRVVRRLSEADLRAELATGKGEQGYQDAVRAELRRREQEEEQDG